MKLEASCAKEGVDRISEHKYISSAWNLVGVFLASCSQASLHLPYLLWISKALSFSFVWRCSRSCHLRLDSHLPATR